MKKILFTLIISSFLLPQLFAQNVGIGTINPQSKLEVKGGAVGISSSTKRYELSYDSTAGYFFIDEFGTARHLVIKNGGNVGIGTINPAAKLDITSTTNNPFIARGTNSQVRLVETDNGNKQWKVEVQAGSLTITEDGVAVPFKIEEGAGNNALYIKNGGNVGIGTNNPQNSLQVVGTAQADSLKISSLSGTGIRSVMVDSAGRLIVENKTIYSNNSGIGIIDFNCASPAVSMLNVQGYVGAVSSANISVTLDITHTFPGDLVLVLEAPNGQNLCLANKRGGGSDNFTQTVFIDNAIDSITTATGPFTGSFKPQGTLDTLSCSIICNVASFGAIGGGTINPNGIWKLKVIDAGSGDTGSISNFTINFNATATAPISTFAENALGVWKNNRISESVIKQTDKGLELGVGVTKQKDAGKITYKKFSDGLDIVGAGTTGDNRKITFFSEGGSTFTGKVIGLDDADFTGLTTVDSMVVQAKTSLAAHSAIKVIRSASGAIIDQVNNVASSGAQYSSSNTSRWQSFTAGGNANLTRVELYFDSAAARNAELRVYEGEGVSGNLLYTTNVAITNRVRKWVSFSSISIPLNAGSKYSIYLSNAAYWVYNTNNTYTAGVSSGNSNTDYTFRTTLASPQQNAFTVSDEGDVNVLGKVKTNEFQIPTGAAANKVLTSDATGNASWQTISNIATSWTVNGNAIYSNNPGNVGVGNPFPIGKLDVQTNNDEPFYVRGQNSQIRIVENDNGNKQWKAEVQSGNFKITEDGVAVPFTIEDGSGANALYVKSGGNVGIGTNNPSAKLHILGNTKIEGLSTVEFGAGFPSKEANAGKIGYQAFTTDALDIIGAGTTGSNRKIKFWNEGGATFTGTVQTNGLQINSTSTVINKMLNGQTALTVGVAGVNNFIITFPSSFTGIPKVTATLETANVNDVFTMSVKQISSISFVVQVYRIDLSGGAWGQSLKVNWSAWE
jgi:subtilisin-like proprotein convertase family protein